MSTVEELQLKLREAEERLQTEKQATEAARNALKESGQQQGEEAGSLREQLQELHLRLDESRKVTTHVEVHNERHLTKFSGEGSITEWVEDATLALEDWSCSEMNKVRFLANHLTGTARDEVRLQPETERDTPAKVFRLLRAAFKSRKTTRQKLGDFFARTQRQGEPLQEYSLALLALQGAAERAGETVSGKLLCQQFVEGMADSGLSRELSRLLDQEPNITWTKLRDQALRWSKRADPLRRAGAVREVDAVDATVQSSAASEPQWKAEMRELREQVKQLTMLMAGASGTQASRAPAGGKGPRTCYKCGSPDHMARECPKRARVCYGCGQEGHFRRECPNAVKGVATPSRAGNGFPPQSGAML